MGHKEARRLNRSRKVTRLFGGSLRRTRTPWTGRVVLILGLALGSAGTLPGQAPSVEVPVTALGNHIVERGGKVFITTQYPVEVEDAKGDRKVAQANSFIDCNAGEKGKDALALDGCRMLFQPAGGDKYYRCKLQGKSLSIRWSHYSFLDFLGNASEEWQGALGGFAVAQTTSLFTPRHTILGVALGWAASLFVNWHYQALYRTPLAFSIVTPDIVGVAVALSLLLGAAAGVLASVRLARTPPLVLLGR